VLPDASLVLCEYLQHFIAEALCGLTLVTDDTLEQPVLAELFA
jgi:hypothetical protein